MEGSEFVLLKHQAGLVEPGEDNDALGAVPELLELDDDHDQELQTRGKERRNCSSVVLLLKGKEHIRANQRQGERRLRIVGVRGQLKASSPARWDHSTDNSHQAASDDSTSTSSELQEQEAQATRLILETRTSLQQTSTTWAIWSHSMPSWEAADAAALGADIKQRRRREAKRGTAVAHQNRIWGKGFRGAHSGTKGVVCESSAPPWGRTSNSSAGVQSGYAQLIHEACGVIDELLGLHSALLDQSPAIRAAQAGGPHEAAAANAIGADKRDASQQVWEKLQAAYSESSAFRDSALDRWHRQVILASGSAAMRANFKTLGQGISAQVALAMSAPAKLISRTQLARDEAAKPLCDPSSSLPGGHGGSDKLANTFNDSDFYAQLLKEFLETGGTAVQATAAPLPRAAKQRKLVDRRASKGRRLRFDVQDKLVNFMAPVDSGAPTVAFQLLQNLFGRSAAADAVMT